VLTVSPTSGFGWPAPRPGSLSPLPSFPFALYQNFNSVQISLFFYSLFFSLLPARSARIFLANWQERLDRLQQLENISLDDLPHPNWINLPVVMHALIAHSRDRFPGNV
jgi:hypothetical protein